MKVSHSWDWPLILCLFNGNGLSWPLQHLIILETPLTHWSRVTHICVSDLIITGSDNGLSPGRFQDSVLTNAGILLNCTLQTNVMEILSKIHSFSFKKIHFKMSSAKWQWFCVAFNVLTTTWSEAASGYTTQWQVTRGCCLNDGKPSVEILWF